MRNSVWAIIVLGLVILLSGSFVGAQKIKVKPGAPAPRWAPIPKVPGVEYAPNLGRDLFRYGERFYNFEGGAWFRGTAPSGPWVPVQEIPPVFYNIGPSYFKVPPGWAQGRKTGWRGAPLPPGQMKKLDRGHIPPGQAKPKKW